MRCQSANKDSVTATVTTKDEAGHSATATDNHDYQVDTTIHADITITSIATDDNVTGLTQSILRLLLVRSVVM